MEQAQTDEQRAAQRQVELMRRVFSELTNVGVAHYVVDPDVTDLWRNEAKKVLVERGVDAEWIARAETVFSESRKELEDIHGEAFADGMDDAFDIDDDDSNDDGVDGVYVGEPHTVYKSSFRTRAFNFLNAKPTWYAVGLVDGMIVYHLLTMYFRG